MAKFQLDYYENEDLVVDSDTGDSSEDDILAMKRRSLILMEQSLELPCDASPLAPRSMVQAETQPGNSGADIEKLLLERVMLRKELRLRGVQERLVETSHRLEAAEARLAEHEALPGWRQYRACCGLYTALTRAGWGGAGLLRGGLTHSLHMVYQALLAALGLPCSLFQHLPASLQLMVVSIVAQLASLVGETADNLSNEAREHQSKEQSGAVRRRRGRRS